MTPNLLTNKITIRFDGGHTGGTNGMHGSWQASYFGFVKRMSRVKLIKEAEINSSSNAAEYIGLLASLDWLSSVRDKKLCTLEVFSDSKLLVMQVIGGWRIKKKHLQILVNRVRERLDAFGHWTLTWRPRNENVALFGH